MFGIGLRARRGHTILNPDWWQGHPLRKEHPARATESVERGAWGVERNGNGKNNNRQDHKEHEDHKERQEKKDNRSNNAMILNLGPHHPGTHGVLRLVLELDGERVTAVRPEIGFHHRGAEKMAERQSWHTYIPYTDRVDYLSGVVNELPYVLSVEKLCGIEVPDRVKVIRIMMTELFRIISHLVWYGTFTLDLVRCRRRFTCSATASGLWTSSRR